MQVLVVVPTYNEAENIVRLLRAVRDVLPTAGMLVVDDGSPDGTADLVDSVAAELGDVHVMRRAEKSGLGSAYRAGFAWGIERGYEACVEMDADFSHDPGALPDLLGPLDCGYEVSIGSRYVPGGSIPNWSWHRHLLSWGANRYASVVLGLGVADSTAGFRVYAASVLRRLDLSAVRAEGYGFQIEMTYRSKQAGARIAEVPISFVDRVAGKSKMSSAIVVEAFGLVALWGLQRLWATATGRPSPWAVPPGRDEGPTRPGTDAGGGWGPGIPRAAGAPAGSDGGGPSRGAPTDARTASGGRTPGD